MIVAGAEASSARTPHILLFPAKGAGVAAGKTTADVPCIKKQKNKCTKKHHTARYSCPSPAPLEPRINHERNSMHGASGKVGDHGKLLNALHDASRPAVGAPMSSQECSGSSTRHQWPGYGWRCSPSSQLGHHDLPLSPHHRKIQRAQRPVHSHLHYRPHRQPCCRIHHLQPSVQSRPCLTDGQPRLQPPRLLHVQSKVHFFRFLHRQAAPLPRLRPPLVQRGLQARHFHNAQPAVWPRRLRHEQLAQQARLFPPNVQPGPLPLRPHHKQLAVWPRRLHLRQQVQQMLL